MKDSQKIQNNLVIGIASQIIAMILGVVLPRFILVGYGSEVNGLLSSVTNIYTYIALVEAGVAAASCQALYKPVADANHEKANAILSATNKYYHKTGGIYLGLIFLFSLLYPSLVKTDIPYITVVLIILFNGFGNVINYFFHGKYLILLKADGKNYVRTGLEIFTNAFKQISKIILISMHVDVALVQLVAMLISFVQMAYISYYIKKHYAWIDLCVEPDMASISKSKNVFVHEINYLITSNADTVLLTVFSNLKLVSVYSMYHLLLSMVNRVLRTIRDSIEFKIAYEYHKDKQNFLVLFEVFEVYYITLVFSLFSIVGYFILPFLAIYTEGISDVNYLDPLLPYAFILIQLLGAGRYPSDAMVHISGHFKQTQLSATIETVINLIISVILVQKHGILGALAGTVISSFFRTNYLVRYINKNVIGRSAAGTYKCWLINFFIFCCIAVLNRSITVTLNSYGLIILFCIPYSIGTLIIYFSVISVFYRHACKYLLTILKKQLLHKRKGS